MQFSRLATLALISVPYVGIGALIRYYKKTDGISLDDEMEITPLQRKAMWVHLGYFAMVPIMIEAFQDLPGLDVVIGSRSTEPSNISYMMICLASENFFVSCTCLGMLLTQTKVPRWAMMTPISQLAWNLKNHVAWYFMSGTFAPEGPLLFALLDMAVIWPITAVYGYNFLYADKKDLNKKE
ncbi:unnamed protein product [Cylindrotheca closterium]|uniref:Uncharacterized protein n=1 Tax=Cylindrotheca closterium TaxID=2856 RepID=A0AAD2JNP3_9STRA|nr:unnamed protein product [Cylindrotheca closterium]